MGKEEEGAVIPTINLQESPFPYAKLREACEEWGCFRVLNHRVPTSLMSEMKTVARSLLDLPVEIKNRNTYPRPTRGYIGLTTVNSMYESLGLHPSHDGTTETFCDQLSASSYQRETIEKYARATVDLVDDISDKIAKSLRLSGNDLFKNWTWSIRMNKYTFTPEKTGSYGLDSHTDYNFLTILQEDEVVGGLEIADKSGSFVTVEPSPGTFVVNLGDMAVAWSNGRFSSVKHRVQKKDEFVVRVSIGVFMMPPWKSTVEAPAELVDLQNPRVYNPVDYDEYKMLCLRNKMHNGEALGLLKMINLDEL